ncbi:MAG: SHOCT domain-containing protein [Saprospiraceae bacterium]
MEEVPIGKNKLRWLLGTNIALTLLLGIALVGMLRKTERAYVREAQKREAAAAAPKSPAEQAAPTARNAPKTMSMSAQDSIVADSLKKANQAKTAAEDDAEADFDAGVTFYLIVLLMLIAGAMGGVMCNLRGFFMHFRGEDKDFPAHLEVPYYVRVFMGAGAGIFVYFVANFLITSLTTEYLATNVPFQGMVSFVALAMLAGFGSLEFFQRLKETALTLFGQKAEKSKWEKIEELYAFFKKGVISEEEFVRLKNDVLRNSIDLESKNPKQPNPQGT